MWMYCHLWRPCHSQGRAGKQAGVHGGHMATSRTSRKLRNAATRGRLSAEGVALYFLPRCLHGEAMWIHCHLWRPCQSQGRAGKKAGVHIVTIARQKLSWLTKPALCGLSRIAHVVEGGVAIGRSAQTYRYGFLRDPQKRFEFDQKRFLNQGRGSLEHQSRQNRHWKRLKGTTGKFESSNHSTTDPPPPRKKFKRANQLGGAR